MRNVVKAAVVAAMAVSGLSAPRPAAAYSVLAHEANIDALWDSTIAPMLLARFPGASREQILKARGYAYGGCVIQDLCPLAQTPSGSGRRRSGNGSHSSMR